MKRFSVVMVERCTGEEIRASEWTVGGPSSEDFLLGVYATWSNGLGGGLNLRGGSIVQITFLFESICHQVGPCYTLGWLRVVGAGS